MKRLLIILLTAHATACTNHQPSTAITSQALIAEESKREQESKKYAAEYAEKYEKSRKEYEEKKQAEAKISKRIDDYKNIKSPTKEQQMQQLIDIQQMQLKLQTEAAKQAETDKNNAELDKAMNGMEEIIRDIDRKNELDNALRKDRLNRALGIY